MYHVRIFSSDDRWQHLFLKVLLILSFIISVNSFSQTKDSLQKKIDSTSVIKIDSTKSTKPDSIKPASGGIDSVVTYTSSDSLVFTFKTKKMLMYGNADVRFKEMSLKSERIDVNWNTNQLEATGVLDSARAAQTDSLKKRYRGNPVMIEGSDKYEGWKIGYNFKSQKGRVTLGETSMDQGYYYGEQIKKIDKDMMFISNGQFTTCEYGHPHFYFFTPEMRMTVRDKIVARPIYLYISDVPVFALPFAVFPSQGGKRSGIIAPAYGDDGRRGRYISHFGYYEAISDYMDFSIAGDWYTSGAYRIYPNYRYAKRYDFTGAFSGEYARDISGEPKDFDRQDNEYYRANLRHNQVFNPTTRLDVDFTFASSNSFKVTNSYQDYLKQEIYSNATFSKSWEGTGNSMSINIARHQDLRLGNVDATLPAISFSAGQSYPLRRKEQRGVSSSSNDYAWYEMIGMGYSSQGLRRESKNRANDSLPFTLYERQGVSHSLSFNASPKAGYFTVSPYFSYAEKWYDKSTTLQGYDTLDNPIFGDKNGFGAVRTFNMGVSASTKLYGILNSPIPGVVGFRHTLTPSLTYNYQPDFSEKKWGYYGTYKDKFDRDVKYNRFQQEVFGGAPMGESQSISLSIGNLFEMKTAAKDTTQKEQKYQLMNVSGGIGYNFVADSMKLSDLSVSYRTDIASIFSISGSANYSFYQYNQVSNTRINKYLIEKGTGIARLTNFGISVSTSLSGEKKQAQTQQQSNDSARVAENNRNKQSGYRGIYEEDVPDFSIPWNLSLSYNFNQSQENPSVKYRSSNMSGNLGFNLTEKWRFSANTSYDFVAKQFSAPSLNIYRDIHCWEMNFQWTPLGALAGYRFELKIKAPQLQDIKVTKTDNNRF